MEVIHFYRFPGLNEGTLQMKLTQLQNLSMNISNLKSELCYNVQLSDCLTADEESLLKWLFASPFHQDNLLNKPQLCPSDDKQMIIEIGPRLNFSTPFSTNVVSICTAVGLTKVTRVEMSVRYLISLDKKEPKLLLETNVKDILYDKMTQCVYNEPIKSFGHDLVPENWIYIDVMKRGREALEVINKNMGLAFDNWDLDYYTHLFREKLRRNPTSVECFDLAQSNSEHSRHWFFKGKIFIDDEEQPLTLFEMILKTQESSNSNNVIKFSDNSSAIKGYELRKLFPEKIGVPSAYKINQSMSHIVFTAETHNFPTGVAPFSGATTGTGGRIRDVQAVGRGGNCIAGTAGYSVGNLLIPGYNLPWEDKNFYYPKNFASPLNVIIEASNGASDYGNKFGEPVVSGYTRSFGFIDNKGERREWVKPIMFSGGVGSVEANMVKKLSPKPGMKIVKVGGPVYRIGVGGGSASSIQVQGDNNCDLDFEAVQRGDPEMENKMNRLIRACIEDSENNLICSIHDQGAGGNGNVLKELVEPEGAIIFSKAFKMGDNYVSTLELWGAEYQESNAILLKPEDVDKLMKLSQRERCPIDIVGVVTGNGKVILSEEVIMDEEKYQDGSYLTENQSYPFNLEVELAIGNMPQKVFHFNDVAFDGMPLLIQPDLSVLSALERVLRHVTVGSKRFLTNKVDRSVTGLIAQQQCVGPLHTPISDVAVVAISIFNKEGVATGIGEQPIKGLINPAAGARMSVAESLTNLMFAGISSLQDVKCSANWMWAAKLLGEGSKLYHACRAMCDLMGKLGIAIDGGKDSLSMAARVNGETVKSPGTLVISTYAPCPNICCVVTPDIKSPSTGKIGILLWVSLFGEKRLGGSVFAQCFNQLGNSVPDVDDPEKLKNAFNLTQQLIKENYILAGHDISDGGLITCILEMAFAGLSGLQLQVKTGNNPIESLFSEEVGWVLEVSFGTEQHIVKQFEQIGVHCSVIGRAVCYGIHSEIIVKNESDEILLVSELINLMSIWEETSFQLEMRQSNSKCATEEFESLSSRKGPEYCVSFDPNISPTPQKCISSPPRVAIIREEGINGDREMAASFHMVGFEVWDVVVQDLLDSTISTDYFRGIVFPGGFSYADVLGSAKGWASCFLFNDKLQRQFTAFAERQDTFSLGVCNGCQLMSLLGWVSPKGTNKVKTPSIVFDHNLSERFECRFSTVRVEKSPAIMCKGMEGSLLGVWVAHGEGRITYKNDDVRNTLRDSNCLPFKYADDNGNPTEAYPLNPNGSADGVAGICSLDGRHLALMPHPERCTLLWQWPYISPNLKHLNVSPWLRLFENAYIWSIDSSN